MKIESKFNPGDQIWNIHEGKATQFPVDEVRVNMKINDPIQIEYFLNIGTEKDAKFKLVYEKDCFATRKDLINSL